MYDLQINDTDFQVNIEITMEVEEHFDVAVPDEANERIDTVGQIADGVMELLAGSRDDSYFISASRRCSRRSFLTAGISPSCRRRRSWLT